MKKLGYSECERLCERVIRNWAPGGAEDEYNDANGDASVDFVEGLILASDLTLELYCEQDGEGLKVTGDADGTKGA